MEYSACRERGTKKKSESPTGIESRDQQCQSATITIMLFNVLIICLSFLVAVIWVSCSVASIYYFNVKCNMLVFLSKIVPVVCTASKSIKIYQPKQLTLLNSSASMEVCFSPSPTIVVILRATTQTPLSTN